MPSRKKYIFTRKGTLEDKLDLFTPPRKGFTKYELVILLAKRAREINQLRIDLQAKHKVHLIEKEKPTMIALKEYMEGKYTGTYEEKETE
jgi:DNA-directed RNA polymerase omega subunit